MYLLEDTPGREIRGPSNGSGRLQKKKKKGNTLCRLMWWVYDLSWTKLQIHRQEPFLKFT